MWNTVLTVNSVLFVIVSVYVIYAAGASLYFLTPRPIEFGIMALVILTITEIIFALFSD